MSAFAALRVELPDAWADKFDVIRGQLVKIVEIYLEARWSWPRRFSRVTDLIFLLEDPRSEALDATELSKLADRLQEHLFGHTREGEISLLLFEGPVEAVADFASFGCDEMMAAIEAPQRLPAGGRLTRIRPGANPVVTAVARSIEVQTRDREEIYAIDPSTRWRVGLTGTYLLSRELFIADLLAIQPEGEPYYHSTVGGAGALPSDEGMFDEICFRGVGEVLAQKEGGLPLGVPLAYSHFARPAQAQRLGDLLGLLPQHRRKDLNVSVYGVPRHLTVGVGKLQPLLEPYFNTINLVTADPGFQIEQIDAHSIACVVFCVRDVEAQSRQAAIRVFAGRHEAYRRRGVHQVLANVRTPAELELAARLNLQIVSGPAICGFLEKPIGGRTVPARRLPVGNEQAHEAELPR